MSNLPDATETIAEVHRAAVELRNFTITFLSLLLYVSLIIASTTHEQILRIDPVKLPVLNVDIPIVGFYAVMPVFLLLMHLYLLVQYYLFSQQVFLFDSVLQQEPAEVQYHLRRNLGNLPFLHWLLGQHAGVMRLIMTLTTVISLIIWPLWTLLWLQMTFLPYHDQNTVTLQQSCLLLDVVFLLYLWAKILDPNDNAGRWWFAGLANEVLNTFQRFSLLWQTWLALAWYSRLRPDKWLLVWWQSGQLSLQSSGGWRGLFSLLYLNLQRLLLVLLLAVLFVSLFVSVLPMFEEKYLLKYYPESWLVTLNIDTRLSPRKVFILTAWLHEQREMKLSKEQMLDYDSGRIRECQKKSVNTNCFLVDGLIPRNLILHERILVDNKPEPKLITALKEVKKEAQITTRDEEFQVKPEILAQIKGMNLQGRHLEYADFSDSILPKADLRRARLKKAMFFNAFMDDVLLNKTQLNNAFLDGSSLNDADLTEAELNHASLMIASLRRANLYNADLSNTDLVLASLREAMFVGAKLNGADLTNAQLNNANLKGAHLNRADLTKAQVNNADLSNAELNIAIFDATELYGVNLSNVQINSALLLKNISYGRITDSEVHTKTDEFEAVLQNLPEYQGTEGEKALTKIVSEFAAKLKQPANFSNLQQLTSPCLSDSPLIRKQANCVDLDDKTARKNAVGYRLKVACNDYTEKRWLVQAMIRTSNPSGQLIKLLKTELAKGDKACAGIAGLPEEWKHKLIQLK